VGDPTSAADATLADMEKWVPWWERSKPAPPPTTVEVHRIGIWTLHAPIGVGRPTDFFVRCDRPGFPRGTGVSRHPHEGWIVYDGTERFSSHESPLRCLEWWVARQK